MKPILFNTEMVRAILDGKKTQTRRPVKEYVEYEPEDILYVRETFANISKAFPNNIYSSNIYYRASATERDLKWFKAEGWNWKPSIHMPKEAARIFLKVTNVRVERLQDIASIEAGKEGFGNRAHFIEKWNEIYSDKGYEWESNPYVWVIEFERCEKLNEN